MKGEEIKVRAYHMQRVDEGYLAFVDPWAVTDYTLSREGLQGVRIGMTHTLIYKFPNNYGVIFMVNPEWEGKARIRFIYWNNEEDYDFVTLFTWKNYAFNMSDLSCEFISGQEVAGCSPEDVYKIIERVKELKR